MPMHCTSRSSQAACGWVRGAAHSACFRAQCAHIPGSLADSKLRLREVKALNFFTNYPMNNPLKALCTGLDKAGEGLSPVARQAVLDELPRAFKHATMLMAALAHTD